MKECTSGLRFLLPNTTLHGTVKSSSFQIITFRETRLFNIRVDAVEFAVKECIDRGILKEYLERKGSQVINMLIAEYDYETDIKVQREEAAEQARAEGMREGMQEGMQKQYEKDRALMEAKDAELEKYKAILASHGLDCEAK